MPLTQYYHTRDPIENLRLCVTLRKISSFEGDADGEVVPVGRTWSYCFRWQEKKQSSDEKRREQDRLERMSETDTKSRRRRKEKKQTAAENKDVDVLSSYIDADDFIPREHSKGQASSSNRTELHLTPPGLIRRPHGRELAANWTANHQRAWLRSNREDKFRAMHVVALVEGHEHVLCSLRFYSASGLLCAAPGFSTVILDTENDPEAWEKGPQLSTYRFTARSGCQYEYALDNVSDLLPFASREDQRLARELQLQEEKLAMTESARWGQTNDLSDKFAGTTTARVQATENAERRMALTFEIVAVESPQTTDPIGVKYELVFPTHADFELQWAFKPSDAYRRHGDTPLSHPQPSSRSPYSTTAAFGWHQSFRLSLESAHFTPGKGSLLTSSVQPQRDKNIPAMGLVASPVLHVSVYSRDSWCRKRTQGYGELEIPTSPGFYDFDVPIRKPIASICDQMEELFLGMDEFDTENTGGELRSRHQSVHSNEPAKTSMIVSRLGQKSESTPTTMRIRLNIVEQFPPEPNLDASARATPDAAHLAQANARIVKRSVHEILQSVKLQKRLATSTDPSLRAALRSLPGGGITAVDSLLASVRTTGSQ